MLIIKAAGLIDVDAGDQYTCALLEDHRVKCWGNGDFGLFGNLGGWFGIDCRRTRAVV